MSKNTPEPREQRKDDSNFSHSAEKSIRGSAEVSDRDSEPGFVGQSMSLQSFDEDN